LTPKEISILVGVYAGPNSNGASERFAHPNASTEYGFFRGRPDPVAPAGRGKKFTDAIYEKLGVTEIDDLAAGIKPGRAPYVDKTKVGIHANVVRRYASA